jgi:hypothetical protein
MRLVDFVSASFSADECVDRMTNLGGLPVAVAMTFASDKFDFFVD